MSWQLMKLKHRPKSIGAFIGHCPRFLLQRIPVLTSRNLPRTDLISANYYHYGKAWETVEFGANDRFSEAAEALRGAILRFKCEAVPTFNNCRKTRDNRHNRRLPPPRKKRKEFGKGWRAAFVGEFKVAA
jgi:hypothetical protein